MGKLLTYTAVLVGLYLVVANAPGFQRAFGSVAAGYTGGVKTLQGR